ncbi:hypothetical protein BDR22DRAFT_888293 [Usnea florida]
MHPRSLSSSQGQATGIINIAINSVFLCLAAVAVGIRLWSRRIQRHVLCLNDYAVILAWVFAAALVITSNIVITRYGGSKHIEFVKPSDLPVILKAYLAADVVWAAANTSVRISVLHFYMTIFRSNRAFLTVAYTLFVLVVAFGVGIVVSDVLTCRPLAKYWDPLRSGVCENSGASLVALSSCNIIADVLIVLLPLPMVWVLQTTTRRKIELSIIFTLGFLICIVTMVRLALSVQFNQEDFAYDVARIGIVTELEPLLGIIIACLPTFPPAIKKLTGHIKSPNSETRNILSSTMVRLRLRRAKDSTFNRFDDSVLLKDLENNRAFDHVSGPSDRSDYSVEGKIPSSGFEASQLSPITFEED